MTEVAALQTALAAEHAAVWVDGVLGAQTSRTADPATYAALVDAYDHHRARRDDLRRRIGDLGSDPVPAAPAYDVGPVGTTAAVRRIAVRVEERCAQAYAAVVEALPAGGRTWAVAALTECAVRARTLGGSAQEFPGAPELG